MYKKPTHKVCRRCKEELPLTEKFFTFHLKGRANLDCNRCLADNKKIIKKVRVAKDNRSFCENEVFGWNGDDAIYC